MVVCEVKKVWTAIYGERLNPRLDLESESNFDLIFSHVSHFSIISENKSSGDVELGAAMPE